MSQDFPKLKISVFADGAAKADMLKRHSEGFVRGFTTNPTLMNKAGVRDYKAFAHEILSTIRDMPISFEVFSDEFTEMEKQAREISSWGANVNVKIPITNTKKEPSYGLITRLFDQGMKLNITAIFTQEQLDRLKQTLKPQDDAIVSIFAGRIADTGVDPMPLMAKAVKDFSHLPKAKILWASSRETLNVYQAEQTGCHIITATDDIIGKLKMHGKSLDECSLDTVKTFHRDAQSAGFSI